MGFLNRGKRGTGRWVGPAAVLLCVALLFVAVAAFAEDVAVQDAGEKPAPKPSSALALQSQDGKYSLNFGLTVQMLWQWNEKDYQFGNKEKPVNPHPIFSDAFSWRRIRPTLSGSLFSRDLTYYYQVNLVPGKIEQMDYYLNYALLPNVQIRVGQCKIPFTRYRINSYKNLDLVDWPVAATWFGGERQVGITIHNGWETPPAIEYEFGVYNGMNSRNSFAEGMALASGYPTVNPSDFAPDKYSAAYKLLSTMGKANPYALDEVHPALALHMAYNYGGIDVSTMTDWDKSGPRFSAGGSGVWDSNPVEFRDFSLRLAPEAMLKLYGWSLTATYYAGFWEQKGNIKWTTLGEEGLSVSTGYLIGQNVEVAGRYSYASTTDVLRDRDAAHGAKAIATAQAAADAAKAAYDSDKPGTIKTYQDAADLLSKTKSQYANAGLMEKEEEFNLGLNFHLIKKTLKLSNDFSWLIHTPEKGSAREDLRFRSQLQAAF